MIFRSSETEPKADPLQPPAYRVAHSASPPGPPGPPTLPANRAHPPRSPAYRAAHGAYPPTSRAQKAPPAYITRVAHSISPHLQHMEHNFQHLQLTEHGAPER